MGRAVDTGPTLLGTGDDVMYQQWLPDQPFSEQQSRFLQPVCMHTHPHKQKRLQQIEYNINATKLTV